MDIIYFNSNLDLQVIPLSCYVCFNLEDFFNIKFERKILIFNQKDLDEKGFLYFKTLKKDNILLIFDATNSTKTRFVVDKKIVDFIINPEFHTEKDYVYQPNSGLDYVIAKSMFDNNITYLIDSDKFLMYVNKNTSYFVKIKQNYLLCKKHGCKIMFVSGSSSLILSENKLKQFFNIIRN